MICILSFQRINDIIPLTTAHITTFKALLKLFPGNWNPAKRNKIVLHFKMSCHLTYIILYSVFIFYKYRDSDKIDKIDKIKLCFSKIFTRLKNKYVLIIFDWQIYINNWQVLIMKANHKLLRNLILWNLETQNYTHYVIEKSHREEK